MAMGKDSQTWSFAQMDALLSMQKSEFISCRFEFVCIFKKLIQYWKPFQVEFEKCTLGNGYISNLNTSYYPTNFKPQELIDHMITLYVFN